MPGAMHLWSGFPRVTLHFSAKRIQDIVTTRFRSSILGLEGAEPSLVFLLRLGATSSELSTIVDSHRDSRPPKVDFC